MADNKLAISLDAIGTNLNIIDKMTRDLKALKETMSGNPTIKPKIETVAGADEAVRKYERVAAAAERVQKTTQRSTQADRAKVDAFISQRSDVVNRLNAASRVEDRGARNRIYSGGGFSPNLASEAELLRIQRQRLSVLRETRDAARRGNAEDADDALVRYNKIAESSHKLNRRANLSELDFVTSNQVASLSQQIGTREDRLAYRLARDRGTITDKTTLSDKEVDARVQGLIRRAGPAGGIANVNALARSTITTHIGQVPLYIQEAEKAGKLTIQTPRELSPDYAKNYLQKLEARALATTALDQPEADIASTPAYKRGLAKLRANLAKVLKDKRGFANFFPDFSQPNIPTPELDKALAYIAAQKSNVQQLRAVGGREFEVTGPLPPVRTTAYPPTIAEMHAGITQQQLDRERAAGITEGAVINARAAAGLPSGPPRDARGRFISVGGASASAARANASRNWYSPSLGRYGPGSNVDLTLGAPNINARLPGDWEGGGGAPPVGYGGGTAAGFGGGGGDEGGGKRGILSKFAGRFASLGYFAVASQIIFPIIGAIQKSIQDAGELEVIMKRIQGIYGGHTLGEQLLIKKEVVGVARSLSTNLLETARTAQLLAQEQIPIGKLAENLTAIAQGAVGLGISQEALANYVIAIRNSTASDVRPLEGPQLVNLIAAFVKRGAVSPQNLMTAIQQIVPALETFSPNTTQINDPAVISAITSVVARRSSYTGSQVANSLKYMIAKFGNPAAVRDIEDRAGIGLGTKESGGQELRPFIEIMQDLSDSYKRLIDTGQTAAAQNLLKDLFGARNTAVGASLLENFTKALNEAGVALRDTGAAADLAAIQQDTWRKGIERLHTAITLLVGPVLTGLKTVGGGLADFLSLSIEGWSNLFEYVAAGYEKIRDLAHRLPGGPGGAPPLPEDNRGAARTPSPYKGVNYLRLRQFVGPTLEQAGITTPGVELYTDADYRAFHLEYQKRAQLFLGQQQAAKDFGALFASPKRDLNEVTSQLERFYETIRIGRREAGESVFAYIDRITGKDVDTAKKLKKDFTEIQASVGSALQLERRRLEGISGITQSGRIEDAAARALNQTNSVRRRLARTYGRRGLDEFPIQTMRHELEELAASRIFDIQRENAAYALRVTLLKSSDDFKSLRDPLKAARLTALKQEHDANLSIFDINTKELQVQTELNAIIESRLKDLQAIETLSQSINGIVQSAFQGLPATTRRRGVLGGFVASLLVPLAGTLFKSATDQIKLTGQGGLFPGIGKTLNSIVGPPSLTNSVNIPAGAIPGSNIPFTVDILKSPEQLRKDQKAAQIRAIEIALASTVGAAVGGGNQGAQVGGQLGAIGGFALGSKLGSAGGPIGALAGGLIGGLFGGLFGGPKPKPELTALEKIARNTGESVTLIENTNRLLELQNVAFNVPTGFTLPRFGPSLFGGGTGGGGSFINVEVNIGGSSASPQQIGNVVAQAVSNVLEGEYRSGGRYVARTTY